MIKGILKKLILSITIGCMVTMSLSGCGSNTQSTSNGSTGESKELNVICWSEYLPMTS